MYGSELNMYGFVKESSHIVSGKLVKKGPDGVLFVEVRQELLGSGLKGRIKTVRDKNGRLFDYPAVKEYGSDCIASDCVWLLSDGLVRLHVFSGDQIPLIRGIVVRTHAQAASGVGVLTAYRLGPENLAVRRENLSGPKENYGPGLCSQSYPGRIQVTFDPALTKQQAEKIVAYLRSKHYAFDDQASDGTFGVIYTSAGDVPAAMEALKKFAGVSAVNCSTAAIKPA